MKRGFFITGTGTGVGKTFVTALFARQAVAVGQRVFAFKPIETGCSLVGGRRLGEDQELLAKAAGDWQRGDLRSLYCFEQPLAPLTAARREKQVIDLLHVEQVFALGAAQADLVLVEGAGGWRVPITEAEDMGALAKRLGLPILVVGTASLGTINHTLLTLEAVRRDGCVVRAVVLSRRPEVDIQIATENVAEVRRSGRCDVVLSDDADVSRLA